ncbi:MAG: CBS domain-containing protein, partial [Halobacteria archaeon]|nr:CBS domain-containing protein [Halobacteria archaeon]
RRELGLTQSQLAERAEVSQPLIARIENGDVDPRLSTVTRIVEVLERAEEEEVTAENLMTEDIVAVSPDDTVKQAVEKMQETQYSQLPVIESGVPVGSTTDALIAQAGSEVPDLPDKEVREVMDESFPTVAPDSDISTLSRLLDHSSAVLVTHQGKVVGIVSDADVAAYVGSEV